MVKESVETIVDGIERLINPRIQRKARNFQLNLRFLVGFDADAVTETMSLHSIAEAYLKA